MRGRVTAFAERSQIFDPPAAKWIAIAYMMHLQVMAETASGATVYVSFLLATIGAKAILKYASR
jgi:hypothetical protein